MLETLMLSRIQFAANISFHILFPMINIALGWMLFYFKLRFNISGNKVWMDIYQFWVKIFALSFALGVVTGITMSFQFGTNWPGFMEKVGNIAGPLLGYEVLTAFFLEATFLGIMLFGMKRVPSWVHTMASFLVAFGTTLSAFWIIALNSWMHTPAGFEMIDGVAHATNWFEIIFNPSFPYRLTHTLLASGLTACFLVTGISAYRLLKFNNQKDAKQSLKTSLSFSAVLIVCQFIVGDMHGLNTLENQPQKIAAMEAIWETDTHVPFVIFAIPDEETRSNHLEVSIPNAGSLILTHHADGELRGLNSFEEHPPVKPLFFGFRIMLAMGGLMLLTASLGVFYLMRKKAYPTIILRLFCAMTFSGWIASLAGWYVTEIGRQPYLVQGILKTVDAVTHQPPTHVALSLTMYLIVYAVLLVAYIHTIFYLTRKKIQSAKELHTPNLPEELGANYV
ncbi:MAG: cytochrome ubiquinol oxidase subunit I [Saccharospirillaceae bacterium]|nr:cytochrome ubiquinol oxidase subunit I [Pseudomonadales bacterium]NRB80258.1 cytochrome ubiquinol oxidase subunit I [Saccharospirillaceae bacterium]